MVCELYLSKDGKRLNEHELLQVHPTQALNSFVARAQALGAAPTCGNVGASSSFIEKVTGKGGRTDDEKAGGQGGHYPQKQQDCPEATVNWKPKTKEERVSSQWSRLSRRGV